jgi:LPS O-antigen subunit length determinant protein (WzzB/FepE family)
MIIAFGVPSPHVKSLLRRKERMQEAQGLCQLRQELRNAYRIRSNAKRISKQVASQVRAEIKAACTARIQQIEEALKHAEQAPTTPPLAQQWP